MTAKEESRKPKQEQGEGRHRPRFLGHMLMKVKPLSANRILANHRPQIVSFLLPLKPGLEARAIERQPGWILISELLFVPVEQVSKALGDLESDLHTHGALG